MPAASPLKRSCGSPPITRPMSAVVPPMSKVSTSGSPTSAARRAPPITPAAGPEAESAIGSSRALRPVSRRRWSASGAAARSRPARRPRRRPREVGAHERQQRGVQRRWSRRGRTRETRAPRGTRATRHAGQLRPRGSRRRVARGRVEEREQEHHADGFDSASRSCADRPRARSASSSGSSSSPWRRSGRVPRAQLAGHDRLRLGRPQVVDVGAHLRADCEHVTKPVVGDQRRARKPALHDRVGRNRRSRERDSPTSAGRAVRSSRSAEAIHESGLDPLGRRANLRDSHAAVGRHDHGIGERAAHVDADSPGLRVHHENTTNSAAAKHSVDRRIRQRRESRKAIPITHGGPSIGSTKSRNGLPARWTTIQFGRG